MHATKQKARKQTRTHMKGTGHTTARACSKQRVHKIVHVSKHARERKRAHDNSHMDKQIRKKNAHERKLNKQFSANGVREERENTRREQTGNEERSKRHTQRKTEHMRTVKMHEPSKSPLRVKKTSRTGKHTPQPMMSPEEKEGPMDSAWLHGGDFTDERRTEKAKGRRCTHEDWEHKAPSRPRYAMDLGGGGREEHKGRKGKREGISEGEEHTNSQGGGKGGP